jgi:hypothetical protein
MNKKQLICMCCGIAAILLLGYGNLGNLSRWYHYLIGEGYGGTVAYGNLLDFLLCVFLISLVTGGLICTFKDKKKHRRDLRYGATMEQHFGR